MRVWRKIGIVLVLLCCPASWATTLSGTFRDPSGRLISGKVILRLSHPTTDLTFLIVPLRVEYRLVNGALPANARVTGNDVLQPGGTYYEVELRDEFGRILQRTNFYITGASYNLGAATPTTITTAQVAYKNPALLDAQNAWTAPQTFTAAAPLTVDTQTVGKQNNDRIVDGFKFTGADLGAAINAASADAGASGRIIVPPSPFSTTVSTALSLATGTVLELPPGIIRFNVSSTISNANVSIKGAGDGGQTSLHLGSATADMFVVTGANFRLSGVFIGPSAGITRTAGSVVDIQAGGGKVSDVNLQDPFRAFTATNGNADSWSFSGIRIQTNGGNWDTLFRAGPIASGTITDWHIEDVAGTVALAATVSAPLVLIDSGVDGFAFVNFGADYTGSSTITQPVIKVQHTGAAQAPSWLHFTNSFVEGSTAAGSYGADILAGRDISFVNSYFTSSRIGAHLNGGIGVRFISSIFLNNREEALLVDNVTDLLVVDSDFSDNSAATNGAKAHLTVAPNVGDFRFIGNRFGNHILGNSNKAVNAIQIVAGTANNYTIIGNRSNTAELTSFGILDGGTGTSKQVFGNLPVEAGETLTVRALQVRRIKASEGTALVAGDISLTAGGGGSWGTSPPAVTFNLGTSDSGGRITVTSGTGTPTANPKVTLTFKDLAWDATKAPSCPATRGDLNSPSGDWRLTAVTTTTAEWTFVATPAVSTAYILDFGCQGK